MRRNKRIKGALELAAEGKGIICPVCKTLAPAGRGELFLCPNCGSEIRKGDVNKVRKVRK